MNGLFDRSDQRPKYVGYAMVVPERGIETDQGLTYGIPPALADLACGDRVIVPLGRSNQPTAGFVVQRIEQTDLAPEKIKTVLDRDTAGVNLPADLVDLARWLGRYYCCPLGMVLQTMLPAAVKRAVGLVRRIRVEPADPADGQPVEQWLAQHRLPPRQRAVMTAAMQLAAAGKSPVDMKDLAELAGAKTVGPVRQLVAKGLLRTVQATELRPAWLDRTGDPPPQVQLNTDQRQAVAAITDTLGRFAVHLLYGVTGSGKTEVYMRAIEPVLEKGQSALVLVPEIALTPQTCGRFIGRFGRQVEVAVMHSGLTASQRHEQWKRIRDGQARLIVGARSAVFAPAPRLGLIVVDEEHDASYKQDQLPRYHGRDVAIKRAQMLDIPLVLGSATPSLESYYNATERGLYRLSRLPRRVAGQSLPPVEIVDLADEYRRRYRQTGRRGVHLLSLRLEQALQQTLEQAGQAILLLNRKGHSNYIACPDAQCGWVMSCEHCDVRMVYHRHGQIPTGGLMRCHYCGFESRLYCLCPVCGRKVVYFGLGTQRLEEELARKFAGLSMLRLDADTCRTYADYQQALQQFRSGRVQVILGTQMITKGLDFPNVRLVGVISADTALNLPDFRATERTFQLIAQVAGRAGRSSAGGRVIVQTFNPANPAILLAAAHDYPGFARWELANRQAWQLPPITRLVRIVVRHRNADRCEQAGQMVEAGLRRLEQQLHTGARIGPSVPPTIARLAGYHRRQIEIFAPQASALQQLLGTARRAGLIGSDNHMAVDVDPVALW